MFNQVLEHISWLHILVAALAYFALGSVWYSPVLFAKKWLQLINVDMTNPDAKKGMAAMFAGSFVLMFITSFGLAILMQILPAIDAIGGIKLSLLIGICFSTTAVSINYIYTKKPLLLYVIDCGYHIVGITIAGAILAAWH